MQDRRTPFFVTGLALLMAAGGSASLSAQEIYRCDEDGIKVFSDTPCGDNAEVHVSGNRLSIVAPADLEAVTEQNQAWLARQHERMDRAAERRRDVRPAPLPPARPPVVVPVFGFVPPGQRPEPPRNRRNDRQEEVEERFSALSGRQPGTRPRRK